MFSFSKYIFLLIFIGILSSCYHYHVDAERVTVLEVSEKSKADADIESFVAPYAEKLTEAMDEVIGRASSPLYLKKPESSLGNFLADIVQEASQINSGKQKNLFSVLNYGGIRVNEIPEGEIKIRAIYELLPFENTVVIMEMNQKELQQFLDHISKRGPWPISKEISYKINSIDSSAMEILINNKPINATDKYYVAMPDYIANGGDDCAFLKEHPRESTDLLLRDAVITYIRNLNGQCTAEIDGRLSYE